MKLIAFKQNSCTPCNMLQDTLDSLGVQVDKVVNLTTATDMEDFALAGKHQVSKTPLLVLEDENGNVLAKYQGVGQKKVTEILKLRGLI